MSLLGCDLDEVIVNLLLMKFLEPTGERFDLFGTEACAKNSIAWEMSPENRDGSRQAGHRQTEGAILVAFGKLRKPDESAVFRGQGSGNVFVRLRSPGFSIRWHLFLRPAPSPPKRRPTQLPVRISLVAGNQP